MPPILPPVAPGCQTPFLDIDGTPREHSSYEKSPSVGTYGLLLELILAERAGFEPAEGY
jgi:hypothetical protein